MLSASCDPSVLFTAASTVGWASTDGGDSSGELKSSGEEGPVHGPNPGSPSSSLQAKFNNVVAEPSCVSAVLERSLERGGANGVFGGRTGKVTVRMCLILSYLALPFPSSMA